MELVNTEAALAKVREANTKFFGANLQFTNVKKQKTEPSSAEFSAANGTASSSSLPHKVLPAVPMFKS